MSVSGAVLTATGIPDESNFTLKTPSCNNALSLTPSGGTIDLTLDSSNIFSDNITQWTLDSSGSTQVAHIVGASQGNTWYAIRANNVLLKVFATKKAQSIIS